MIDIVKINGVTVTDARLSWFIEDNWDIAISMLTMKLSKDIDDLVTLRTGLSITIERRLDNYLIIPYWGIYIGVEYAFNGIITQVIPEAGYVSIVGKGKLIDAIKSGRTKSWDKDIDVEAGVGSEIFKDLCDNSGLSYSATSITSTGTDVNSLITKFIQNDESDFEMMNDLAERYNYTISYDNFNDVVNFKPKGYSTWPQTLVVGTDIPGQIKWKENMEQMINKVKIFGATVYDKVEETFTGPATTFTLTKTPEDTEVRDTNASGTVYVRGQKDVGIIGTDFDYYVDVEQKKIVFSGATSNVWIRYGAQVPMPVIISNPTSIATYGGPNAKPHFKRFDYPNLKDIKDAEDKGRAIINKYSLPFTEIEKVPIADAVLEANYGFINPGMIVKVTDSFNNKTEVELFVQQVQKTWPHVYDRFILGDWVWRTEDWQTKQMQKINALLGELNKNQDIIVTAIDLNKNLTLKRRYFEKLKIDRSGSGVNLFVLGHPTFGVLGTQELGDSGESWETVSLVQANNTYEEYVYDTDFYDAAHSSGVNWSLVNNQIVVGSDGDYVEIGPIALGYAFSTFTISFGDVVTSDSYTIEISANGRSDWEELTADTELTVSNYDTTGVHLRITAVGGGCSFEASYDTDGEYSAPAIKLIMS